MRDILRELQGISRLRGLDRLPTVLAEGLGMTDPKIAGYIVNDSDERITEVVSRSDR